MRKFVFGGLLLCALALLGGIDQSPALAQKGEKGGTIEIKKGNDGKYRFTIRNADAKLLAMSGPTGYATEKDAEKVIEELKTVLKTAKVTRATTKKGGR